jgi:hypothetical protein
MSSKLLKAYPNNFIPCNIIIRDLKWESLAATDIYSVHVNIKHDFFLLLQHFSVKASQKFGLKNLTRLY